MGGLCSCLWRVGAGREDGGHINKPGRAQLASQQVPSSHLVWRPHGPRRHLLLLHLRPAVRPRPLGVRRGRARLCINESIRSAMHVRFSRERQRQPPPPTTAPTHPQTHARTHPVFVSVSMAPRLLLALRRRRRRRGGRPSTSTTAGSPGVRPLGGAAPTSPKRRLGRPPRRPGPAPTTSLDEHWPRHHAPGPPALEEPAAPHHAHAHAHAHPGPLLLRLLQQVGRAR